MKKEMHNEMDGIEELYKSSFSNFSMEPSNGLFEKIQLALPQPNASISLWAKYKVSIMIATAGAIMGGVYFFYSTISSKQSKDHLVIPAVNKSELSNPSQLDNNKSNTTEVTHYKKTTSTENKGQDLNIPENSTIELIEEQNGLIEDVQNKKVDIQSNEVNVNSTEETKPVEVEVKQEQKSGMDFYKKHSQNYKDSLRQLFAK